MNKHVRTGLLLGLCVLFAVTALSLAQWLTQERREQSRQQWLLQSLSAVLPEGPYDANPLSSRRTIIAPELGSHEPLSLYTVTRNDKPLAAVLSVIAPGGYNGDIKLLLGIHINGEIVGVRVTEHHETPGLGDKIEHKRSDWITAFNNRSLLTTMARDWAVRKQGGQFDAFTGATITPKAVINAVHQALQWYKLHDQELYQP